MESTRLTLSLFLPESILENAPLLNVFATQQSELTALTRACQLEKGKSGNIYTHSCYPFGNWHVILLASETKGIFNILRATY